MSVFNSQQTELHVSSYLINPIEIVVISSECIPMCSNNAFLFLYMQETITFQVVDTLLYFMALPDIGLKYFTLQSLGSVCIRHYELMLTDKLRDMYHSLLLDDNTAAVQLRIQTLCNIETYLQEEDIRMMKEDQECEY